MADENEPLNYGFPYAAIDASVLPVWLNSAAQARFSVEGKEGLKVSALGSLDRGIRIEAGTASGDAVTTVFRRYETQSLPLPDVASRWYLVAIRRNWSGSGTSTLVYLPSGTTAELPPIGDAPTQRSDKPGIESDQPLALVRVTQKDRTVQEIIDLRCWAGPGGVEVVHRLALNYLAEPGASVKLGSSTWRYEAQANGVWDWREYPAGPFGMFTQQLPVNSAIPAGGQVGPFRHNFPAGRFSQPPVVTFGVSNPRLSPGANGVSTSGFDLYIRNDSNAATLAGGIVWYTAVQVSSSSAPG